MVIRLEGDSSSRVPNDEDYGVATQEHLRDESILVDRLCFPRLASLRNLRLSFAPLHLQQLAKQQRYSKFSHQGGKTAVGLLRPENHLFLAQRELG